MQLSDATRLRKAAFACEDGSPATEADLVAAVQLIQVAVMLAVGTERMQ